MPYQHPRHLSGLKWPPRLLGHEAAGCEFGADFAERALFTRACRLPELAREIDDFASHLGERLATAEFTLHFTSASESRDQARLLELRQRAGDLVRHHARGVGRVAQVLSICCKEAYVALFQE